MVSYSASSRQESPADSPASSPAIDSASSGVDESWEQDCSSSTSAHQTPPSAPRDRPSLTADLKEKRKRSRVTPQQLVQLEQSFAADRSPTAARRKEISKLLGMNERQTQIWFQNRRAKAKLQEMGAKAPGGPMHGLLDVLPGQISDANHRTLINEDGPICIMPCTDLTVGTWKRMAMAPDDLVAYVSEAKQRFSWFIQCEGTSFKMNVPFSTVIDTKVSHLSADMVLASIILSHPPQFFAKSARPAAVNAGPSEWKRCADWTEDMQATKVMRHDLVALAGPLYQALGVFNFVRSSFEGGSAPAEQHLSRDAGHQRIAERKPQSPRTFITHAAGWHDSPRNSAASDVYPLSHSPDYVYNAPSAQLTPPQGLTDEVVPYWGSPADASSGMPIQQARHSTAPSYFSAATSSPHAPSSMSAYNARYSAQDYETRSFSDSPPLFSGSSGLSSASTSPSSFPSPENTRAANLALDWDNGAGPRVSSSQVGHQGGTAMNLTDPRGMSVSAITHHQTSAQVKRPF
ncbi:uncharacterized protein FIBRA_06885 [Fibroporia radiculosa]|uniref:Homeobox domain-containing protein n=1 Tax=Fibroporia radiculosa TaxID=599839 RepID=J4H4B4_9APHY|nr:uncharacterized protein FIBRA_06885 [Fibroporia radiculosa]CCM04699.1 predicted protein [Fibroporia radiculosa]